LSSTIAVRVTPRSSKPGIGRWLSGAGGREELEVRVAEPPTGGAANEAVVKVLSKALGISRSEVSIISGHVGRHKRVVTPFEEQELRRRLGG
jgi:uncharacterized protein (TIGR00251 family)